MVKAYTDKGLRVEGVWLGAENSHEEIQTQQQLEQALKDSASALHLVDARRTLIDRADLPFDPKSKDMPDVYTTFRQKVENLGSDMIRPPLPAPESFKPLPDSVDLPASAGCLYLPSSDGLKNVLPQLLKPLEKEQSRRDPGRSDIPYRGGMTAGGKRLSHYCVGQSAPIATYKETRNGLLGQDFSTKFSPWLANGSLSPKVIYEKVEQWENQYGANKSSYWIKCVRRPTPHTRLSLSLRFELLWRDFFSFLIERHGNKFFFLSGLGLPQQEAPTEYDRSQPRKKNSQGKETLDGYWLVNDWHKGHESDVQAWCQGRTGVPFIDASQIELITTGYQSNRSRQNIASHFTKDMGHQDWRIGAEFFESNLIDHDVSSNVSCSVHLSGGWRLTNVLR